MKRSILAAALAAAFAVPAWAADAPPAEKGVPVQQGAQGQPDLKQRKAQIIKGLDERIAAMQQDKKCVQTAKNDDDLRNCRQKSNVRGDDRRRERGPRQDRDRMHRPGVQAPAPGTTPAPPALGK